MRKISDSISLFFEITEVMEALEGAQQVLRHLHELPAGEGEEGRKVLAAGVSVIGLSTARLRLLAQVLQGEVDPVQLLTPRNRIPDFAKDANVEDVLLRPWSQEEQCLRAKRTFEQVQGRLKRQRKKLRSP